MGFRAKITAISITGVALAFSLAVQPTANGLHPAIYTGDDGALRAELMGTNQYESDPRVIDLALAGRCDQTAGVVNRACENVAWSHGINAYPVSHPLNFERS